jgi:hypothetical protein
MNNGPGMVPNRIPTGNVSTTPINQNPTGEITSYSNGLGVPHSLQKPHDWTLAKYTASASMVKRINVERFG